MNDSPLPWRKLRERHTSNHRVFSVHTWDMADPRTNREYVRTVIEAPDWVNIIPVTPEGNIVLVRQFRFGVWANTLEIPGGLVDPGEAPDTTARRELEEETGYRPDALKYLGTSHPNPAIQNNRLHSFLATGCHRVHAGRQDESEDLRVEVVSRPQLVQLVRSGAITHSLVLTALLYEVYEAATP